MDQRPASPPVFALLLLFVAIVAVFVIQVRWVVQDRDTLISQFLYEDAFYYFQTARSIAEGHGSMSSGGIRHNGYHPLWLIVCSGFFRATPSDLAAIQSIMLVGALLTAVTSVLVFLILREVGCRRRSAVFAAICFDANPWMMSLAVSGMEAPLNALLLAMMVLWTVRPEKRPSGRVYYAILGILMALVYLVRTDNVFFIVATWLYLALRGRSVGATSSRLFGAALLALVIVTPWISWNLLRFGGFMQTSAGALPVVRRAAFFASHPDAGSWDFFVFRLNILGEYFPAALMYSGIGSVWYILLVAVLFVLWTGRGRDENPRLAFALFDLAPLFVSALCLGVAHKFFRLATREWYYVTTCLFLALVWGILIHYMMRVLATRFARLSFLLVMIGLVIFIFCVKGIGFDWTIAGHRLKSSRAGLWTHNSNAYALDIVHAIERLPDLAPDEKIGATDSGIVGFLSRRPVVNLDGVVNPEAAKAIRRGELLKYADSLGIRYMVITPRMYIEPIWGKGFNDKLVPYPPLTAEGYRRVRTREETSTKNQ